MTHDRHPDQEGRIIATPGTCDGLPRLAGSRISTATFESFLQAGWTIAAILAEYPHMTRCDILAAHAFERGRKFERERILEG